MMSSFALLASTGLASAGRYRGAGGGHGRVVEGPRYERGEWRGERGEWRGERGEWRGERGEWRGERREWRGRYEGGVATGWAPRYEGRHWIYARRPIIREHYYDRWHRPEIIVEDYGPMDGYVWIAGCWQWNGVEWIWYPGHYEPAY